EMFVVRLLLPCDRAEYYTTIEPAFLLVPLVRYSTERLIEKIGKLVAADVLLLNICLEPLKIPRQPLKHVTDALIPSLRAPITQNKADRTTENGYHAGEDSSEVSEVSGGIIVVSRYEARLLGAHLAPPFDPRGSTVSGRHSSRSKLWTPSFRSKGTRTRNDSPCSFILKVAAARVTRSSRRAIQCARVSVVSMRIQSSTVVGSPFTLMNA